MVLIMAQALLLLALTFFVGSVLGWTLSRDPRRKSSGFVTAPAEVLAEVPVLVANTGARRVSHLASMTPEALEAAVIQAGTGLEPIRLSAPQGDGDDLKIISGVGPVNERELNELGVYHYWQIAEWGPEQVAWIAQRIRFPNRVMRENWVAQAARLAKRAGSQAG